MQTTEERFESAMRTIRGCGCAHAAQRADALDRRWLRAATDEAREAIASEAEAAAAARSNDARNASIYTPGAILDEMNTVRGLIAQLDRDIVASSVDDAFKTTWRVFFDEYEAFYRNHLGWLDRFWIASYEKATEYRQRTLDWRKRFSALGGRVSAPVDTLPEKPGAQLVSAAKWLLIGGGVFFGLRASGLWDRLLTGHSAPAGTSRKRQADQLNESLERAACARRQ